MCGLIDAYKDVELQAIIKPHIFSYYKKKFAAAPAAAKKDKLMPVKLIPNRP
jgi:hypothetical protein